jgi:hypothetical protein
VMKKTVTEGEHESIPADLNYYRGSDW